MSFVQQYLAETKTIIEQLDPEAIERMATVLSETRAQGGRLFVLGVGGTAANASHAVNDFRKIADIEAYAPTDNVSELTARTNDDGWSGVFEAWLRVSRLRSIDAVLAPSVRWRDIDAGHQAGCTTILIDFGYAEKKPAIEPHARVGSLREAVAWIQRREGQGNVNYVPCS